MIQFKENVRIKNIQPQTILAIQISEPIFDKYGLPLVITSINDSIHGIGSLHGKGLAVDFRSKHVSSRVMKEIILVGLRNILFPLGYDVLFEDPEQENEHYHVEYDPK